MRTVQMTLDVGLVEAVDGAAKRLGTTRSAFTRRALSDALERLRIEALEQRHRRGYERHPVGSDEFSGWEDEQAWPDLSGGAKCAGTVSPGRTSDARSSC